MSEAKCDDMEKDYWVFVEIEDFGYFGVRKGFDVKIKDLIVFGRRGNKE